MQDWTVLNRSIYMPMYLIAHLTHIDADGHVCGAPGDICANGSQPGGALGVYDLESGSLRQTTTYFPPPVLE